MNIFRFASWTTLVLGTNILGTTSIPTNTQTILRISDSVDQAENAHFAIGFDLSASFGTAAISFPNKTTAALVKIPADDAYKEMMYRLSLPSSEHLAPPYQNPGDAWADAPRQAARKAHETVGLPASRDVGHLANMLTTLRSAIEKQLPSIPSPGVTTLNIPALYQEDLLDVCEYAKLSYLKFPMRYDILYETSAAYAGYRLGLCSDFMNKKECKQEQDEMDSDVVMAVLLTSNVLTVSLSVLKSAYYLYEPATRHFSDFDLGYDNAAREEDPLRYWNSVESQLKRITVENPYFQGPSKVLLMGDHVRHGEFRDALNRALSSRMETLPDNLDGQAEFAAAEGTAELAKRLGWDTYSITVGALPIIEQALIGRRQLRGRVTSEGAFCDIFAPVSITQSNQDRL